MIRYVAAPGATLPPAGPTCAVEAVRHAAAWFYTVCAAGCEAADAGEDTGPFNEALDAALEAIEAAPAVTVGDAHARLEVAFAEPTGGQVDIADAELARQALEDLRRLTGATATTRNAA